MNILKSIVSASGITDTAVIFSTFPSGPGALPTIVIVFFAASYVPSVVTGEVDMLSNQMLTYFFFAAS